MSEIIIIDYGMGNLRSVQKAFNRAGSEAYVTGSAADIENATKLVLPGVGHFKKGMSQLRELQIIPLLNKKVMEEHTPILGICLGAQLFTNYSEEGHEKGLGWIDAKTIAFEKNLGVKIPHMGWNSIEIRREHPFLKGIVDQEAFYFVHSYYLSCHNPDDVICTSTYGHQFVSAMQRNHIFGMQFHPEKSHQPGLQMLRNFISL